MSLIAKSAFFHACENCGRHGVIVLSNGSVSRVLTSKEEARDLVSFCDAISLMSGEEVRAVLDQIEMSKLPEEANALTELFGQLWNENQEDQILSQLRKNMPTGAGIRNN